MTKRSTEDVDDAARERQHERSEAVERVMDAVEGDMGESGYPVTSEDLAEEYGSTGLTTTGEENIDDVLENLPEGSFDSPEEVREAIERELLSERRSMDAAPDPDSTVVEGDRDRVDDSEL